MFGPVTVCPLTFCVSLSESRTSDKELVMIAGGNQSILLWMGKKVKVDL